jgi:phage-related protein
LAYYRSDSGREPVSEWVDRLAARPRAKLLWVLARLAEDGLRMGPPWLRKLDDDIWEVRVTAGTEALRVLFCPVQAGRFLLLEAFAKKTAKTPERHLQAARTRLTRFRERRA